MYDASNRKDIRRAEKAAKQAELDRINYLCAAMSTQQGRTWFWSFLESCHIFSDPFTGSALHEAYSKGERNVGLQIYHDIVQHCPDDFIKMAKEAHERSIERSVLDNRSSDPASVGEFPGEQDDNGGDQGSGGDIPAAAYFDNFVDYGAEGQ